MRGAKASEGSEVKGKEMKLVKERRTDGRFVFSFAVCSLEVRVYVRMRMRV